MHSWNAEESAVTDRLVHAIAPARMAAACAIAGFAFAVEHAAGWRAVVMLVIAAALLVAAAIQMRHRRSFSVARAAVIVDSVAVLAALSIYPGDRDRMLTCLLFLVMVESAALLRGRLLLAMCLAQLLGFAVIELAHPGDKLPVFVRLATGALVTVAVRIVAGIVDEERDRVRRLTVGLRAVIWESDRSGRLTYVNDEANRLFGTARGTITDLLQLPGTEFLDQLFSAGAADVQVPVQTADGRSRWLQVSGRVIPGRRVRAHGIAHDITEVKGAEQRLRDIFDTVDLLATITAVDGTIVYINDALAAVSGRTADELIGRDWIETLSAATDADVVEHRYAELREGRIVRNDENSIETPSGDVRLIAWSSTILRNSDGTVYGAASIGQDITDRRRAEDNLRASEERFRTLSENVPVGIFQTDADSNCIYVNDRWTQMTALSFAEAMGRGWSATVHPDDIERAVAEWRRARDQQVASSMEVRFLHRDGRLVWAHANVVPLRDAEGRVMGHLGTIADITERRLAQDAVIESEHRLRTVTDNINDVIFVYGMNHRLQWVTPSIEWMTGFTPAELFERNTLNDVHPEDEERMLELWRALFRGESYTGAEFRFTTRAGVERWCWSAGNPVYDSDNVQVGVQIRDADITLQKQAELRLRDSEQRSRAIIETTSDAFVSASADGAIQEWNRAAEHMFGLEHADAVGAMLLDVIPAESSREPLEHALAALRPGGDATIELVAHRADGTPFAAEVRLWTMHVDGAVTLNAFLRDITERKRREEQVAFMAYHDPLTGLPNRAMLEQHLDLVLLRARHDESAAALLFLDIDRFKQVNDTYGHDAGDQLLCETAVRLRSAARAGDLVVRLGGDEFVLVLGDLPAAASADIATAVASRVHLELRAPYRLEGVRLQTSTSVGIAIFPGDGADATSLLHAADSGMYASKRAGRGGTSFAIGSRWAA
jgi:diguanylate cyclase (GGDEF)-like protein/PAS domain S-box-containing protein